MGKPNYKFAKRQRELAKKKKKEEKLQRKTGTQSERSPQNSTETPGDKTTII